MIGGTTVRKLQALDQRWQVDPVLNPPSPRRRRVVMLSQILIGICWLALAWHEGHIGYSFALGIVQILAAVATPIAVARRQRRRARRPTG